MFLSSGVYVPDLTSASVYVWVMSDSCSNTPAIITVNLTASMLRLPVLLVFVTPFFWGGLCFFQKCRGCWFTLIFWYLLSFLPGVSKVNWLFWTYLFRPGIAGVNWLLGNCSLCLTRGVIHGGMWVYCWATLILLVALFWYPRPPLLSLCVICFGILTVRSAAISVRFLTWVCRILLVVYSIRTPLFFRASFCGLGWIIDPDGLPLLLGCSICWFSCARICIFSIGSTITRDYNTTFFIFF